MTEPTVSPKPLEFTEVARPATLTTQVVQQMETMITRHSTPGSRFPSERELASLFGVSRTVIREAVSGLTSRGLLRTVPGSGTLVGSPSSEAVSRSMALFLKTGDDWMDHSKVHEVRRALEVEIAGLAALRHESEDLEAISAAMLAMEEAWVRGESYVQCDVDFHRALAVATRNSLFPLVLDAIADVMFAVREIGLRVPGSYESGRDHHRIIYAAVVARDEPNARTAMLDHLLDSEDIMQRAIGLQED